MSQVDDIDFPVSSVAIAIVSILLLAVLGWALFGAFQTVDEDEVHVVTQWGEATGQVEESGQYWLTRAGFIPDGISYGAESLTVEPVTMTERVEDGLSQDGQDIDATVSVTYQLDADEAFSFFADTEQSGPFNDLDTWEERVGERAIQSAVQDATAGVSALEIVEEFDAEEGADIDLLRTELQESVEDQLAAETSELSPEISIREVRVEEVELSEELNDGLEEIAVERAEAERQIVDAQADAEAEIERAEGDAQAEIERAQGQAEGFEELLAAYGDEQTALQAEFIEAIDEDEGTLVIDADAAPILDLNTDIGSDPDEEPDPDTDPDPADGSTGNQTG